jgi:hypothetical protein
MGRWIVIGLTLVGIAAGTLWAVGCGPKAQPAGVPSAAIPAPPAAEAAPSPAPQVAPPTAPPAPSGEASQPTKPAATPKHSAAPPQHAPAKPAAGAPAQPAAQQQAAVYTCPMHPEVQQSTPGKCPKCGMNLEKKS